MLQVVIITAITATVGFIFFVLQRVADKLINRTKESVDDMGKVVSGYKGLNEEYRIKIDEQDVVMEAQDKYIKELEGKVIELGGTL